MYVRIRDGLGQGTAILTDRQAPNESVFRGIQNALRRGLWFLALRLAVLSGTRDENKLTNLVFFARHPERQGRKLERGEPKFQQLGREWLGIREHLVRPVVRPLSTGRTKISPEASSDFRPSKTVLDRIAQYESIIERVASEEKVNPNWIKGVIAAESGGKAKSGEGTGGYKGLMQAEQSEDQLRPETSIRTGAQKLKRFRASVSRFLERNGLDPRSLSEEMMIRLTMVAYNAGPATLKRAMSYAIAAGHIERWMEPEHFQRALVYYGAYSVREALRSCLQGPHGDTILAELAKLAGMSLDQPRDRYFTRGRVNHMRLWNAIKRQISREKEEWARRDKLTLEQIRRQAPRWLTCSVEFKHKNLRTWYLDRIIAYMRHYSQVRTAK